MKLGRAYSLLNVREIVESVDFVTVRGMASTPTTDRMDDIVDPMGAKFATPMPLLLYHNSTMPVGHVTFAKATKDGIPFEAQIPIVREPGTVKDRIDEAIHSLKYRLIAAVSIGFRALKDGYELLKSGGIKWTSWEWLELSLVVIPANSDATITAVKSIDHQLRAASGAPRHVVVRVASPGVSGTPAPRRPGVVYLNPERT